jgi:AcrR family transcriptional regulator
MAALPPLLEAALFAGAEAAPKRERTRRQLLLAAVHVYGQRGVRSATLQEIATAAGVASGTIYNYFPTREALASEVALWLANTLCQCIADSYAGVKSGVERMAIGNRRYLWLAQESPAWASMLLEVGAAAPELARTVHEYALADLRLGVRQKGFRIVTEAAAMNLINGTISSAMQAIALGMAPAGHAAAVAETVLRGLGVPADEARAAATMPLPELPSAAAAPEPAEAGSAKAARRKR